jgi:hypothetical protein
LKNLRKTVTLNRSAVSLLGGVEERRVPILEQKEVVAMSSLILALVALTAPPSEGVKAAPPPAPVSGRNEVAVERAEGSLERADRSPRKGVELREAVRAALRRWARPSDREADAAAREFLTLYEEIQADDQLSRSQRRYFRNKVRSRLMRLRDQIALRVARQKRLAEAGGPKPAEPPEGGAEGTEYADSAGATSADAVAAAPTGSPAFGGGAFGSPDYGQQLVELIQTVIQPETWDVHGGPGTIYYWYPGRALVIRQTQQVHEEIGGVLGQLRRAGP